MKKPKPVTRQAVQKAIREGKLKLLGTGRASRIDLDCPLTKAWLVAPTNPGKATAGTPPKAKRKRTAKKAPPADPVNPAPKKTAKAEAPPEPSNADEVNAFMEREDVKSLKIRAELEKLNINNREKRGELVRRDLVQGFIHAMHEIDNGQWGTLDLKIASDLAALLEVEDDKTTRKIAAVVKREVKAILKQVKREQNKFLKKLGAEKIPKGRAA
ncbi:MAG: hypothetical protein ACYTEQ_24515 [Planctomycetota bacterium]